MSNFVVPEEEAAAAAAKWETEVDEIVAEIVWMAFVVEPLCEADLGPKKWEKRSHQEWCLI